MHERLTWYLKLVSGMWCWPTIQWKILVHLRSKTHGKEQTLMSILQLFRLKRFYVVLKTRLRQGKRHYGCTSSRRNHRLHTSATFLHSLTARQCLAHHWTSRILSGYCSSLSNPSSGTTSCTEIHQFRFGYFSEHILLPALVELLPDVKYFFSECSLRRY